jgi:hypothetical protein
VSRENEFKVEFHVSDSKEIEAVLFLESRGYQVYKQHSGRAVVERWDGTECKPILKHSQE